MRIFVTSFPKLHACRFDDFLLSQGKKFTAQVNINHLHLYYDEEISSRLGTQNLGVATSLL